jgi:Ser/Thr protein kinase RdoA (MazF antagonist)
MTASDDSIAPSSTPYAELTPSLVLDALDGIGLRGDGRLIQLNSYENRVFQVFLEDGRVVVAKFYRPGRWSDAQILEEHAFAAELAAAEIPVAAPWVLSGSADSIHADRVKSLGPTLGSFESPESSYRYAVSARLPGRAPELEDPATLEWIGRFVGRIHAVGASGHFQYRETLDVATFARRIGIGCLSPMSSHPMLCPPGVKSPSARSIACVRHSQRAAASACCACTATATSATCCGPRPGPTSSISTTR